MKRNVKVTIGVLTIFIGICVLLSTYFNSTKLEVFDDMNEEYYNQVVSIADEVEEKEDEVPEIKPVEITTKPVIDKSTSETTTTTTTKTTTKVKTTTDISKLYIGTLSIPKINLQRGFFDINSKYNNVNKNIYVHPSSSYPNSMNGNLILAAHSGTSSISYFKNLYKLQPNDDIYVKYKNKEYHYQIKKIYKVEKTGSVSIQRNKNVSTLTLITCSKNDSTTQTVYICELV